MKLFDLLKGFAIHNPECIAFQEDKKSITYRFLWELIIINRYLLIEKGFQNQVVIYKVGNQFKFAIDFLCLMAAGCWVVPITQDVSKDVIQDLITTHGIEAEIDSFFLLGEEHILPEKSSKLNETLVLNEKHCGIYHLTSGTTDKPKICVRSLHSLSDEGVAYGKHFSLPRAKIVSLAPIYHSFAFGAAYMTSLITGASLYLFEKFIPRKAVEVLGLWKANIVIAVPIMINAITKVSLMEDYDYTDLSIVLVGTGAVSEEVRSAFKKRFGTFISTNYGSTETGGVLMRLSETPADSIGKEMDGVEVKLVRRGGYVFSDNKEGEVYIRCKYMMETYLNDETNVFDEDGFLPMGDIMKKDEQGFYYIQGRIKNYINVGGKKVNPREVEELLIRYPGVQDCIVCRTFRENRQEIVKAIIEGEALLETDIREYLRRELADYKIPSIIEVVKKISRNELGKVIHQGKNYG